MTLGENSWRIPNAKLQLSNGYAADFDHFARLLNVVCRDDRGRIPLVDIAEAVGLAERHMKGLCGLASALGLLHQITYKPTPLGRLIEAQDPFLDDIGTLWFLHYVISSDRRNLVWNCVVAHLLPNYRYVTREQVRTSLQDLSPQISEYSVKQHIGTEFKTVVGAYTNQHFSRLAYLRADGDRFLLSYRAPVPALVLAGSITCFRDRYRPGDTAIPVADLLMAPNSPGVVFQLDEAKLRATLEQLKRQSNISLESRADLDQVRLTDNTPYYVWMERYYASG
ncbi:MAG TPA: DUF4007 family protein [Chloroflexia bacterium]|jgi:hypothetical protein